jgi:hypothetical protein
MPRGPKGEKRHADPVKNAVRIARIATGEEPEVLPPRQAAAGKVGGPKRAKSLSPERRAEIAKKAADKRWDK